MALSLTVAATIYNASSETSKARISSSVFKVISTMTLILFACPTLLTTMRGDVADLASCGFVALVWGTAARGEPAAALIHLKTFGGGDT